MASFSGYDIGGALGSFNNLMQEGYNDRMALERYNREAEIKAQQQAFANELAGREAEARYGVRSYDPASLPGLYEQPMGVDLTSQLYGNGPLNPPVAQPQSFAVPGSGMPAYQAPVYRPAVMPSAPVVQGRAPSGFRDPAMFAAPVDSGVQMMPPNVGGNPNPQAYVDQAAAAVQKTTPTPEPDSGSIPQGITAQDWIDSEALVKAKTSQVAKEILPVFKEEKKPERKAQEVAKRVIDTHIAQQRNPAMSLEEKVRMLGGYIDPSNGRVFLPKGTSEAYQQGTLKALGASAAGSMNAEIQLLRLQQQAQEAALARNERESSRRSDQEFRQAMAEDQRAFLAAQAAAADAARERDLQTRLGSEDPNRRLREEGYRLQYQSLGNDIAAIDRQIQVDQKAMLDPTYSVVATDKEKEAANARIKGLMSQREEIKKRQLELGNMMMGAGSAPQVRQDLSSQAPVQPKTITSQSGNKVSVNGDGTVTLTRADGKSVTIREDVARQKGLIQ